jgi:hypothetical protein
MQALQNKKSHNQMYLLQILIVFRYCNNKKLTKKPRNFHQMMETMNIIKLLKTCTIFLSTFNLMYVNSKTI